MRLSMQSIVACLTTSLCIAGQAQDLKAQLLAPLELKPVTFAAQAGESIGVFTSIANAVFKPAGAGPFPAIVLMHTCGGVRNPHIKQHAQEFLKEGYVVLVVDSFGPRGMESCVTRLLSNSAGIADAYAGLAFLAGQSYVDPARIYQVGYSWGGLVSTLLGSPQSASLVNSPLRFAATVAHYASCTFRNGQYQMVLTDADRPVLMLMGENDQELPPASCFPRLEEIRKAGVPVEWHVFPGATHGWDKSGQQNRGYYYNEQTTQDASAKTLEFLARKR